MLMPRRVNNSNLFSMYKTMFFLMVWLIVHSSAFAQGIGLRGLDRHVGDIDWSLDGTLIAYTKANPRGDGYHNIWTVRPDATGHKNISRDWQHKEGFPHKHVGGVAWHPSGKYLVFVAQNNDATGQRLDELATPGSGLNCNLWLATKDGLRVWPLTRHKTNRTAPRGVLHPQFSRDGKLLTWAEPIGEYASTRKEIYQWGKWAIKVAQFQMSQNGPHLQNIQTFRPGKQAVFYETHDFSPDGRKILFCGNLEKDQPLNGIDIYELDIDSGQVSRLTRTFTDWDEHAHYSPDGKLIAWASGAGFNVRFPTLRSPDWLQFVKLDLWVMNVDGSNLRRITFFNEPGHADFKWFREKIYDTPRVIVSDGDWSPDGKQMALTIAYEGADKQLGSFLVLLEMKTRLE